MPSADADASCKQFLGKCDEATSNSPPAVLPLIDTSKILATTPTTNVPSNYTNSKSPLSNTETSQLSQPYYHPTSAILKGLPESVFQDLKMEQHILPNNIIRKNSIVGSAVDATLQQSSEGVDSQNNTNICGYVTQQQLANFGTNVALASVGRELNT